MLEDVSGTHSQELRELHKETVQMVEMYNENCIKIISHLLTNLISFVLISFYLILGKNKIPNFRVMMTLNPILIPTFQVMPLILI